jgi:hypothetical protein
MSGNKCFSKVGISHVLRFMSVCDLFIESPCYLAAKAIMKVLQTCVSIILRSVATKAIKPYSEFF